jgi:pimeloyl-ACP methyl ester carboxylesterase
MGNTKRNLILLPGTLCNEKLWTHQIEQLSNDYNVKVGDLTKDDSINGMAKRILDESPERFILVGLSLGGMVALEIMKKNSERVEKLILLDTNPYLPSKSQIENWRFFKKISKEGNFEEVTSKYLLPNLLAPENNNERNKLIVLQMAEEVGQLAMFNQLTALENREDNLSVLEQINIPTLIIVGKEDVVCPIKMSEYMYSHIPCARMEIIEKAGHLSSLEKPREVTSEIYKFL